MKKKNKTKNLKKTRDLNILLSIKGEISLGTKSIPDKKKYSRKEKHKG